MKYRLLLAFVAMLAVVPFASFMSGGADGAAAPSYDITGYAADTKGDPITDVELEIIVTAGGTNYKAEYDSVNGFFKANVGTNTGLSIKFNAHGYTAITCPSGTKQLDGSFSLNLSKATYSVSTRTYSITGSIFDGQYVIMRASTGEVSGHVSYVSGGVKNATVTLTPTTEGATYTATTDNDGNYRLPACATGSYYLTVSRQGFIPFEMADVSVKEGQNVLSTVTMEQSERGGHLGLDTAHLLMLIGVIVGVLIVSAAWLLSKRMNGPNRVEIFDDSTKEEEEELR